MIETQAILALAVIVSVITLGIMAGFTLDDDDPDDKAFRDFLDNKRSKEVKEALKKINETKSRVDSKVPKKAPRRARKGGKEG